MRKALIFLLISAPFLGFSQSSFVSPNENYYHLLDRYEVKSGRISPYIFTTVKPWKRSDIVQFVDTLDRQGMFTSNQDRFNLQYVRNDNWEWARPETNDRKAILKYFYKKKSDLFYVDKEPDFDLHVNPVLYLGGGMDSDSDDPLFINSRGVEMRGMLDKKIGFYMFITENQTRIPSYVSNTVQPDSAYGFYPVIPHEGFWKGFKEDQGYDFFQARGYISFEATRHLNIQFGHDRTFIGSGFRSLIFSDHAPPSMFLKANVKVWKLNYLFQLNRMVADVEGNNTGLSAGEYPDKYVALHHLSVNIGKKLNIGVFESVVFNSNESNSFDFSYLNPVIFYRAIEHQFGSSDNVILGADFKWLVVKGVSLYGQFVLDEFKMEHIKARDGWWANKFGIQAGLKYFDAFGVSNLDLQAETNIVRPYTYSHDTPYGSYSNYMQPIAHPLGANFKEYIGIARYQPLPRLHLTGKLIYAQVGRDSTNTNSGGDILKKNNINREADFGNVISQGVKNNILNISLTASWQLAHNMFIDASVMMRKSESPVQQFASNATVTSVALRWNISQRFYDF